MPAMQHAAQSQGRKRGPLRWAAWLLVRAAVAIAVLIAAGWATLAIEYSNIPIAWLRTALAVAFAAGTIAAFIWIRPRIRALAVFAAAFMIVFIWYRLIPASNDRDWTPDVAVTPTAEIDGDRVVVHNVRNFHYRSETDFDVHYEDRTYDLSRLRAADLIMSYWGPRAICHTFITAVFDDGQHLCMSIETRKEKDEGYSAIQGMFRRFELVYVFADERDLIGLRTDHRHEDVYLYRLRIKPQRVREIFMDYMKEANELAATPAWYNALTDSCSVGIIYHSWSSQGHRPFRLRYLLNGHWDEYLYQDGGIFNAMPFDQLRAASRVNERAQAAGEADDFSAQIRVGIPMLAP